MANLYIVNLRGTEMTIYDLKPAFQDLLRPIVRSLVGAGITANQVTASAIGLSGIAGFLVWCGQSHRSILWLVPIALFLRMALNAIDGMIAREFNSKTKLGCFLNELGDVISDSLIYLPFAFIAGISPVLMVITVILAVMSEMTGVISVMTGNSRRYDGPLGKSDRAFAFSILAILLAIGIPAGLWTNVVLGILVFLSLATILNRVNSSLREVV